MIHSVHHSSSEFNLSRSIRNPWLAFHHAIQFPMHSSRIGEMLRLERFVVTPSFHRAHHGIQPQYDDRNFGEDFTLWDRIFGTAVEDGETPVFGLLHPRHPKNALEENFGPWKELWRDLREASGIKERVKVLFFPPEYVPVKKRKVLRPETVTPDLPMPPPGEMAECWRFENGSIAT